MFPFSRKETEVSKAIYHPRILCDVSPSGVACSYQSFNESAVSTFSKKDSKMCRCTVSEAPHMDVTPCGRVDSGQH